MSLEVLKNISGWLTSVGGILAAVGAFGVWYFGNQLEHRKDSYESEERKNFTDKIDILVKGNEELKTRLTPFEEIASQKFPGIQVDDALKKLTTEIDTVSKRAKILEEKVKQSNPLLQSINSAVVTVEITIESDSAFDNWFVDAGGFVGLGKGNDAILIVGAVGSNAKQLGNGRVVFRGTWSTDASSIGIGKPIQALRQAEYLQIMFQQLPENSKVIMGAVNLNINSQVQVVFNVPQQIASGKNILNRQIGNALDKLNPSEE